MGATSRSDISLDLTQVQRTGSVQNEEPADGVSQSMPAEIEANPPRGYTTFTSRQKRLLTVLVGLSTITSPLTATMYFPLLPLLRTHFHTSAQAINLTLTVYIVFQALSPLIFAPYSDTWGRRPVYIATLVIYCAGNIGLALNQSSLAALLVLRAFQSLGASAAYAVSYGVVADVCVRADRGSMLGPVNMALNLGTCIGPVVGGWVAYKSRSYEWCFWALVILGLLLLGSIIMFLPETARYLVGNGSKRASHARYRSLWSAVCLKFRRDPRLAVSDSMQTSGNISTGDWNVSKPPKSNPLQCLRILLYPHAALSLWLHGSFYVVDYALVAAAPDIYGDLYHFNELQIGMTYLTRGAGIIVGSFFNGRFMDYNYRFVARQAGWTTGNPSRGDLDHVHFPIERARSRGSLCLLAISTGVLIAYGWTVSRHVYVAVPLILQFILGFIETTFYTVYSTLLVDAFPSRPSTAAAAASVVRCSMAATAVATLQPLMETIGRGWCFTTLGLWSGGCGIVTVLLIRHKAIKWRLKSLESETLESCSY